MSPSHLIESYAGKSHYDVRPSADPALGQSLLGRVLDGCGNPNPDWSVRLAMSIVSFGRCLRNRARHES